MKEISEKLANELHEIIKNVELQADLSYKASKKGDITSANRHALVASVYAFDLKTHLEWHMHGHLNSEAQSAPEAIDE